jgi:hypothetical protein
MFAVVYMGISAQTGIASFGDSFIFKFIDFFCFAPGTKVMMREGEDKNIQDVKVGDHIYTTDFYQPSAFRAGDQILSIYYRVNPISLEPLKTRSKAFDFSPEEVADKNGQAEHTRWIALDDLSEATMSLPIDKIVVHKILQAL